MQHPGSAIDTGVGGRQNRRDQDEIHQMGGALQTDGSQHLNEGAGMPVQLVPGNQAADDENGQGIEQDHPENEAFDHTGQHLLRILGLCQSQSDEL
ncbi:hypothetical protein D3C75_799720 [compost metagenome]